MASSRRPSSVSLHTHGTTCSCRATGIVKRCGELRYSHNADADDHDHDRDDDGCAEVLAQPKAFNCTHEGDVHELHDLRMSSKPLKCVSTAWAER